MQFWNVRCALRMRYRVIHSAFSASTNCSAGVKLSSERFEFCGAHLFVEGRMRFAFRSAAPTGLTDPASLREVRGRAEASR